MIEAFISDCLSKGDGTPRLDWQAQAIQRGFAMKTYIVFCYCDFDVGALVNYGAQLIQAHNEEEAQTVAVDNITEWCAEANYDPPDDDIVTQMLSMELNTKNLKSKDIQNIIADTEQGWIESGCRLFNVPNYYGTFFYPNVTAH